jgi:hypothetical protein
MLAPVAARTGILIAFPIWRIRSRPSTSVFLPYTSSEALERAQARLLWACTLVSLLVVATIQIVTGL